VDQLSQLFQPFNRLGQESGNEEGTGIGLVVTKQLVELMGGTLGVTSVLGEGSVFWMELNSADAPRLEFETDAQIAAHHGAGAPQAQPIEEIQPRTLLYVEDNPANLALVEQLIARRSDIRLLTAINAYLGIQLARAYAPDVILMDINLPGISGFDALKILQLDPATAHIPVIALSANAMPRDVEKGIAAGFFRYLIKPIKVDEFMQGLNTALLHAEQKSSGEIVKVPEILG